MQLIEGLRLPSGDFFVPSPWNVAGTEPSTEVRRSQSIDLVLTLEPGPLFSEKRYYRIHDPCGEWEVVLGKPGKEAGAPVGAKYRGTKLNPHDIAVTVTRAKKNLNLYPTFQQIYQDFEMAGQGNYRVLQVCGALLVRNALMVDHVKVGRVWRYRPPLDAIDFLGETVENIGGLPPVVYLQMLDALALNEDVKYVFARGYALSKGTGRPKNVLTGAHVLAVLLGVSPVSGLVGALIAGDRVAPLDGRVFPDAFPDLVPY